MIARARRRNDLTSHVPNLSLTDKSRGSDDLVMHMATVSDSLVVSIAYESADWEAESKTRRAKATKLY